MKVLNVGGRSAAYKLPDVYNGWEATLLDYTTGPDVQLCMDIRFLHKSPMTEDLKGGFDAIYCSHTLEHIEKWDLPDVVEAFNWALKPGGWLEIWVPDLGELATKLSLSQDPDTQAYDSPAGPITIGDLIYGYGLDTREDDLMRHRNGFTLKSLRRTVRPYFKWCATMRRADTCELLALCYRSKPLTLPYPFPVVEEGTGVPKSLKGNGGS